MAYEAKKLAEDELKSAAMSNDIYRSTREQLREIKQFLIEESDAGETLGLPGLVDMEAKEAPAAENVESELEELMDLEDPCDEEIDVVSISSG